MGICPLLVGPNLLKDQIITVLPPTELQLPLAAKAISSLKPKLAPPLSFTTRCRQTQQQLLSFTSGFSSAAVTFTMWSHKNLHPMIGIWILLFLLSQAALSSEFHSALQRLQRIVLDASIERSTVGASGLRIICFAAVAAPSTVCFFPNSPKSVCSETSSGNTWIISCFCVDP